MVLAKVSSLLGNPGKRIDLDVLEVLCFFNNPKNLRKYSFQFAPVILLTILWIVFTNLEHLITEQS